MCGCHFSYMRATSDIFLTSRYFQAFKHLRISQVYISRGLSIKHGGLTRANEFANNIYVLIIFKPNKKGVKTLKPWHRIAAKRNCQRPRSKLLFVFIHRWYRWQSSWSSRFRNWNSKIVAKATGQQPGLFLWALNSGSSLVRTNSHRYATFINES